MKCMKTLQINYHSESSELCEIGKNMIQINHHNDLMLRIIDIVIPIHYFMTLSLTIEEMNHCKWQNWVYCMAVLF